MKRMVWEPVDTYQTKWRGTTLTFSFWDKGTSPVIITESDATHIVLLDTDVRLCRLTETDVPSVPVEAMRRVLEFAEIGVGHDQYDPELQAVRAWLDEQAKGGE